MDMLVFADPYGSVVPCGSADLCATMVPGACLTTTLKVASTKLEPPPGTVRFLGRLSTPGGCR